MSNFNFFKTHTNEQQADSIAAYMPGGDLAVALRIPETNMRMFIEGLAVELGRVEQLLIDYTSNYIIDNGALFLEEWEASVGVPDNCFDTSQPDDIRQAQILCKLAMQGAQTEEDFERVAAVLGYDVKIVPGIDSNITGYSDQELRFTIVVNYHASANPFTFTFPFIFGDSAEFFLECIFTKIKPANCQIIMNAIQTGEAIASDSIVSANGTVI